MTKAEHDELIRRMEAILHRVGVTCTRKQAAKNECITCSEMYRKFDNLKRLFR